MKYNCLKCAYVFSSAPELGSLWNPSLRKTLSHPAAAHKSIKIANATSGTSLTSKSLRYPGRDKKLRSTDPVELKSSGILCGNLALEGATEKSLESQSQSLAVPSILGSQDSEIQDTNKNIDTLPTMSSERHRKNSLPLEKRSSLAQQSPPKSKRNFFEGFKNSLRPKSKTDSGLSSINGNTSVSLSSSHSLDSSSVSAQLHARLDTSLNKDSDMIRRWSETNSSRSNRPSSVSDLPDDTAH